MPLWDSYADQILTLPVAAAVDAVSDRVAFAGATQSAVQSATLLNTPRTRPWMLSISGVGTSPVASTTIGTGRRDGFRSPLAMTLMRLRLTITTAFSSGTAPSFDLFDETAGVSVLDNTTVLGQVLTPSAGTTLTTDDPVDVAALPQDRNLGAYCTRAATSSIGATWMHLEYAV